MNDDGGVFGPDRLGPNERIAQLVGARSPRVRDSLNLIQSCSHHMAGILGGASHPNHYGAGVQLPHGAIELQSDDSTTTASRTRRRSTGICPRRRTCAKRRCATRRSAPRERGRRRRRSSTTRRTRPKRTIPSGGAAHQQRRAPWPTAVLVPALRPAGRLLRGG